MPLTRGEDVSRRRIYRTACRNVTVKGHCDVFHSEFFIAVAGGVPRLYYADRWVTCGK